MSQQPQRPIKSKLRLFLLAILIAIVAIGAKQINLPQVYQNSLNWVQSLGMWGPIAYIGIYNLATLLFVPGSILTMKAGCLFGLVGGSIYVLIGATLGATFAFCIGRYFSRDWVCRQISKHRHFQAIDRAVAKEGLKIVLLTRLSPIFPFNLLNYIFGVTQVSLKDYILGSIGMIPGTILYVYIGTLADNLATLNANNIPQNPVTQIGQWVLQGVGLIAAIAITVYLSKISRQALTESMAETDANSHNHQK